MIIGCIAINRIPVIKVYIKYNIEQPKKHISILINFLFKVKYHLIYLLLKNWIILSIFIYINKLNNKTIIKLNIIIAKTNNNILKSLIWLAKRSLE